MIAQRLRKTCCCGLGDTVTDDLGRRLYIAMRISYDTFHGIEATHCVSELEEPQNALELVVRSR